MHAADAGAAPGISADVQLPPAYPTGVLLGCVEVVDVITVRASSSPCCLGKLLQALQAAGLLGQPPLLLDKLRRAKRHVSVSSPLQAEQVEGWAGLPGGLKAEVGSPHCFLCEQPQRLVVPHVVRGQHKIWPLDKQVNERLRWWGQATQCGKGPASAAALWRCTPAADYVTELTSRHATSAPVTSPMQLHKNAQLGLKPAPNGRDFRWGSFGAPPPPGGLPPSQV